MKTILVSTALTTGLDPAFASMKSIAVDDTPVGQGGFGAVYRARAINGGPASPQVVKLLLGPSPEAVASGLHTTRELQRRLGTHEARLRGAGSCLVESHPALAGVPQVSFEGSLDGRPVVGYIAHDLSTLGMEDFANVLTDPVKRTQLQTLPLEARVALAAQLVDAFEFLSTQVGYIHADIKAEAIFVDLARTRCAVIDFDGGAVITDPSDRPTTIGTRQDWLAPEIVQQLNRPGNAARIVHVDLLSDVWSVNMALHYLLFGVSPLFFLSEVSARAMRAYAGRFRWPDAGEACPYFRRDYRQVYANYLQSLRHPALAPLVERFAFTMNNGYANPAARTSYGQWKSVLTARTRPAIKTFQADRTRVADSRPVRLEWSVSGAMRLELSGVGDVTGRSCADVPVCADTTFTLTLVPYIGRPISRTIDVTVARRPPIIARFRTSRAFVRESEELVLDWDVRDATEVTISPGPGTVGAAGRLRVRLRRTTRFVLKATSSTGIVRSGTVVVRAVGHSMLLPAQQSAGFWPRVLRSADGRHRLR